MKNSTIRKISFGLTTIIILVLIWAIVSARNNGDFLYPSIGQIIKKMGENLNKDNTISFLNTIFRVLIAVTVSIFISLIIICLYIRFKNSISFFSPIITLLKTVPFICISLFIILLFSKTKFIGLMVISIILILPIGVETLKNGVDNIPRSIIDDLNTLDISFFRKLFSVYLPLLLPNILLVFLETFGLGFKIMIMAEYFMQMKNSVGILIYNAKTFLEMDSLIGYTIIIVLLVGIGDILVKLLSNRLKIEY